MENREKEARIITSAQKCLQILSYMATISEEISINDLVAAMKINKSTMHHYLATLVGERYVLQNPENKKYRIGPEAFRVGECYLRKDLPYQDIDGVLKDLQEQVNANVYFYIHSGEKVTCVLMREKSRSMYSSTSIGSSLPLHASAAGKVFLAFLPEHEREKILSSTGLMAYTKKTITDRETLNKELTEIRLRGYAVNDGEYSATVAISVPVFGFGDRTVAAVSVAGDPSQLNDKQLKMIIHPLVKYGQLLSDMVHNVVL